MQAMRRTTAGASTGRIVGAALGALLLLGAVACSSGSKDDASSGTDAEKSAVAPETTSTTAAKTTTTALGPPPPAGSIPFIDLQPQPPDSTSPWGSGCTPQASTLPDGQWFGRLKAIDTTGGTIGFDLECLFVGDAANAAAAADGKTEIPVPDDVYVRNENETVRTQPAVSDVAIGVLGADGNATAYEPTSNGLATAGPLIDRPVWIEVQDGWVIAIQQQYFP